MLEALPQTNEKNNHNLLKCIIMMAWDLMVAVGFVIYEGISIKKMSPAPLILSILYVILIILVLISLMRRSFRVRLLSAYRYVRFAIGALMVFAALTLVLLYAIYEKNSTLATGIGKTAALVLCILCFVLGTIQICTGVLFHRYSRRMKIQHYEEKNQLQQSLSAIEINGISQVSRLYEQSNTSGFPFPLSYSVKIPQ